MRFSARQFLIWLAVAAGAMFVAAQYRPHAEINGEVVPMGPDSFYHAERMIDAAGDYGFYEFDTRMHVPEGSWVTWPYAYDFLAGKALQVALAINPGLQPMQFLGWLPVVWILLNAALFLGIGKRLGWGDELLAIAGIGFALSGIIQALHGFGVIDHHYIELTFVMASTWALMGWLGSDTRSHGGVLTGIVLGLAPAFHTGAFILQLPFLIVLFLLWLRHELPPTDAMRRCAIALLMTALIVVLLSEPAWDGQFALTTLSWFHAWVALCSAAAVWLMGAHRFSAKRFTVVASILLVLGLPLLRGVWLGARFLSSDILLLDNITEVQSPFKNITKDGALRFTLKLYSGLLLLLPVLLLGFARGILKKAKPTMLAFYVFGIFGLILLSVQGRLVYFGFAALFLGTVHGVHLALRDRLPRRVVAVAALALMAIALQPQLKGQLFSPRSAGLSQDYELAFSLFEPMAEACAEDPGTVIAQFNDGHPVRYHTDCSVLGNAFIITPQHERLHMELQRLLNLSPQQFLDEMPDSTRYLFVHLYSIYLFDPVRGMGVTSMDSVREFNPELFITLARSREPIDGFELIQEVRIPSDPRGLALGQLYRVTRQSSD